MTCDNCGGELKFHHAVHGHSDLHGDFDVEMYICTGCSLIVSEFELEEENGSEEVHDPSPR